MQNNNQENNMEHTRDRNGICCTVSKIKFVSVTAAKIDIVCTQND